MQEKEQDRVCGYAVFLGNVVTTNPDGSIPISAKLVAENPYGTSIDDQDPKVMVDARALVEFLNLVLNKNPELITGSFKK